MTQVTKMGLKAALIATMLIGANHALADDAVIAGDEAAILGNNAAEEFLPADAVSLTDLDENRGTNTTFNINGTATSNAESHDNQANGAITGAATNSGFSNNSGVSTGIINTGNNVIIQSSTVVNLIWD